MNLGKHYEVLGLPLTLHQLTRGTRMMGKGKMRNIVGRQKAEK